MMMTARRIREVFAGIRRAFRYDNPWEFLVNWHLLRRRNPIVLRHLGFEVCVDARTSDLHVVGEILLQGMYDEVILKASRGREGFGYINLGANIGAFELRVAQLVKVPTRGLAVEMSPFSHARLLLNLELNHLCQIMTLNAGATDGQGSVLVSDDERDTGQTLKAGIGGSGRRVLLVGWEEVVALYGSPELVDLLKVDIEGSEGSFLRGFAGYARCYVRWASIESHGVANQAAVEKFLEAAGFEVIRQECTGPTTCLFAAKNRLLS